jgi:hypothetical protein
MMSHEEVDGVIYELFAYLLELAGNRNQVVECLLQRVCWLSSLRLINFLNRYIGVVLKLLLAMSGHDLVPDNDRGGPRAGAFIGRAGLFLFATAALRIAGHQYPRVELNRVLLKEVPAAHRETFKALLDFAIC